MVYKIGWSRNSIVSFGNVISWKQINFMLLKNNEDTMVSSDHAFDVINNYIQKCWENHTQSTSLCYGLFRIYKYWCNSIKVH